MKTSIKVFFLGVAICCLNATSSRALMAITAGQVDDFEDGTAVGWTEGSRSPNQPVRIATGGNPGGYLENVSSGMFQSGGRLVMFNETQWAGDYNAEGITAIDVDLQNFPGFTTPLSMRIALEGAGSTRYSSTEAFSLPADGQWHTASFGLTTDELTRIQGSASLEEVLASVDTLRILAARPGPAWRGDAVAARLGVDNITAVAVTAPQLQAGDANMDLRFDQRDLVQVQVAAKYLTGQPATWGQGDWNSAPGGQPGNPPLGDGLFNQRDIVAAQQAGVYLTGPYAALRPNGNPGDGQMSVVYHAGTGEVSVDAPDGVELTSINIDSASGVFTGEPAQNLGGSFDNDADYNIFKATFGSSFSSLSFGRVAQAGLSEDFVLGDFTVIGSLSGGGDLGEVDLVYVPEPAGACLCVLGFVCLALAHHRRHAR